MEWRKRHPYAMMLKTCGYCDKDIKKKPHIGVANAYNSAAPGHAHLRQLAEQVKQGIWAAGGIPVEFGIPSTCGEYSNGNETLNMSRQVEMLYACQLNLLRMCISLMVLSFLQHVI